ncbi:MAG: hypothetical protein KF883_02185 [Thermomicrobiales bacterium]|jgi:hypothetical protein|nr:hypothetical protein [Thermomicrobiales bacterium]
MRTTLDIDEDILFAAKEMARERNQSTGKVLSDLVRESLASPLDLPERNGFPQLPIRDSSVVVTMEMVNELRDELP